jgi:hypothetical protein
MYDDVSDFDGALEHIAGLIDQVRGKLGDRFLRLELADHLAPKSTPFRLLRREWMLCIFSAPSETSTKTFPTTLTKSTRW